MTHSYTIRVCHITHACVWHEIYLGLYDSIMCHNMMHSYLWHDSFIHVPCLLHACDVTGEIWHIHVCDVTLMCEKHLWRGVDFLQHTAHLSATYCNVLQHAATHCNTLQYAATRCNTLQHTAPRCTTLQHAATRCNTLQHAATRYTMLQHTAALQHTISNLWSA